MQHPDPRPARPDRTVVRPRRWLLGLLVAWFAASCWMTMPRDEGPQHGWWSERGPVVPHENFPLDCGACHKAGTWHELVDDFSFDHAAETGYVLEGAHARAQCLRCHNDRGPVQEFLVKGCAGCHEDRHLGRMGSDCAACHEQQDWSVKDAIARHDRTRFPLIGAHASAACWACHPGAQQAIFDRAPTTCSACHQDDLATAVDPDHAAQGWTSDCQRCHVPTGWRPSTFDHGFFPLTGAHRSATCSACHEDGFDAPLPNQCAGCHQAEYDATTDPNHVAAGFPPTCEQCHNTSDWDDAFFTHAGITSGCFACHANDYNGANDPDHIDKGFPTTCEQCHVTSTWNGAVFQHTGITSGCVDCHLTDYQGANDPDHVGQSFPTTCEQCHGTASWDSGLFTHDGIASGCADCHLPDYQGTTAPNHSRVGFPPSCEQCHGTRTWLGATFDHAGVLSGCITCHQVDYNNATDPNHVALNITTSCEQCHGTTTWAGATFNHAGIVSGCLDCHQSDYNGATDPNHVALNISTSCEQCHNTTTWDGALFNHAGINNGCADCHLPEFQNTTDPNHTAAGFPTSCESCHTTTTWNGATFDHDFPLVGNHNVSCNECHVQPRNFSVYSCTVCHGQGEMDDRHDRVGGYVYQSPACYNCHPNGVKK